jgi:hypothetical protein
VWDSGLINKEKETEDIFVFLTSFDDYIHPLKLNLLEMWCSLILQTLTRNAITAYCEQVSPHAGKHLNVALPLHQCYNGEKRTDLLHGDLYRSHDPLIQEYWKSLRRAFYDLKYSENPLQRAYYDNTMKRQQKAAGDTERNRTAKTALNGMEVILRVRPERSTQEFVISHFKFNISPRWVRLKADATIQVRCYLENENHPHAFALASSSIDPACRLGIHIGGIDLHGNAFEGWLQSKTSKAVLQMNTFVDMLEGLDIWDPADRKRRWVPGKPRGGPKPYYV